MELASLVILHANILVLDLHPKIALLVLATALIAIQKGVLLVFQGKGAAQIADIMMEPSVGGVLLVVVHHLMKKGALHAILEMKRVVQMEDITLSAFVLIVRVYVLHVQRKRMGV